MVTDMAIAGVLKPRTVLRPLNRAQRNFLDPSLSARAHDAKSIDGSTCHRIFPDVLRTSYLKGKDAAMSEMQQGSWTKPAAMAIPKGGFVRTRSSRAATARSSPRRRRATASRIIAKIIPAREPNFYEHAKKIEKAVAEHAGLPRRAQAALSALAGSSRSTERPTFSIRASSTPTSTSTPRMP